MDAFISRRTVLQAVAATTAAAPLLSGSARAGILGRRRLGQNGHVRGRMTGAKAVVATLKAECTDQVFGIPGAQQNEMWDAFKTLGLPYLLVTHEYAASCAADGYARATGKPGVICVVPGPGLTNALTGIGEALLDSIPMVCIVGDVANGKKAKPFQVHSLNQRAILESVTKCVFEVKHVSEIPYAIRQAFAAAVCGEPGPVGVVIPYNLLIEAWNYDSPPLTEAALPWDEAAAGRAVQLLSNHRHQVGIYAGLGCMDHGESLRQVAEILRAPVATSISGKGVISECHPLAVGWGFGPHAGAAAEGVFKHVDCLLAIGVKFSEVSTGYYSNPQPKHVIHVDANENNLGRVLKTDVCVHADAGVFLSHLIEKADCLRRPENRRLNMIIGREKSDEHKHLRCSKTNSGIPPAALVQALRRALPDDGMLFVDVTVSEHIAAEAFRVCQPRTFFNPTDNQAMG
jgi:acetolactate synthase-1/2/3 large subunit